MAFRFYIVRCVNLHEELVGALHLAIEIIEQDLSRREINERRDAINSVLAKAKGKA